MSAYMVADSFDNAAGLTAVAPQPSSIGIQYAQTTYSVSHTAAQQGPFVVWEYISTIPHTDWVALLASLGLSDAVAENEVTIRTLNNTRVSWVNKNAVAFLPELGRSRKYRRGYWRDVKFFFSIVGDAA